MLLVKVWYKHKSLGITFSSEFVSPGNHYTDEFLIQRLKEQWDFSAVDITKIRQEEIHEFVKLQDNGIIVLPKK